MMTPDKGAVRGVSNGTAAAFVEQWHYSHRIPTGKNICFGWYVEREGLPRDTLWRECLYAVAVYGIGVNPYQASSLAREVGRPIMPSELVELKRLARVEPKVADLPLTWFLARCHRYLHADDGYKWVVSFSDPGASHTGGIYRAANFNHLGKTNSEIHLITDGGEVRHRRLAYRLSRREGISTQEARDRLGVSRVKTQPKDRWLLQIGGRR